MNVTAGFFVGFCCCHYCSVGLKLKSKSRQSSHARITRCWFLVYRVTMPCSVLISNTENKMGDNWPCLWWAGVTGYHVFNRSDFFLFAQVILVVTVYSVIYQLPLPSYILEFRSPSLSRKWPRTLNWFNYFFFFFFFFFFSTLARRSLFAEECTTACALVGPTKVKETWMLSWQQPG